MRLNRRIGEMNEFLGHLPNGSTELCAIFGHPVSHSFSPAMHTAHFRHQNRNAVYIPLDVAPENLGKAVDAFRTLGFRGANVTIPHKESIGQYLDHLDGPSAFTGSVNTLYYDERGRLCGTTTDARGALSHLRHEGIDLQAKNIQILGTGGAARALAFVFAADYGEIIASLTISGRNPDKTENLSKEILKVCPQIKNKLDWGPLDSYSKQFSPPDLLINATSVGMHPAENQSPFPAELIRNDMTVYDIIYNPAQTLLLKNAATAGARTLNGLGMLIHQGALSYEYWFGQSANVQVMQTAFEQEKS